MKTKEMFFTVLTVIGMGFASCSDDSKESDVNPEPELNQSDVIYGGEVSGVWEAGSTIRVKGSFEIPHG